MNQLKTLCLGLLLTVAVFKTSAQTTKDSTAITKQDALDFITKVINLFPATPHGDETYTDFKETVTLDGCTLIVKKSYMYSNYSGGKTFTQDSIVFNLSSSTYDDKENYPYLAGFVSHYQAEYKKNGKLDVKETEQDKKRGYDGVEEFTQANIYVLLNTLDHNQEEFDKKDYVNRFPKAFAFLIKTCGGSKKTAKEEKPDKF
jgi:hypothetical protein